MTLATRIDRRAAGSYASAVARHLRHLPRAQRRRLVADLRTHLLEMPGGSDLREVLGPPDAYATELLRTSGLPEPHGFRAWLRRVPLPWKVAASLVFVLAVVGTIGGVWINGYEPLVTGGASFAPGIQPDPDYGDHANVIVDYQHDARYRFGFSIYNHGRLPVEIEDFPLARYATAPFVVEQVLVDPPNRYGDPDAPPFRPFTLQPGEDRGFTFRGVLAHCDRSDAGGSITFESINVEYRVLGVGKTQDLPLSRPIRVRMPGPETAQCPYPHPPSQGPLNGNGTQILGVLHGGNSLDVQLIASRAPTGDLRHADWKQTAACDATPPDGFTAVPLDIVASRSPDPYIRTSPVPVELQFSVPQGSPADRILLAAGPGSHRCDANSVRIETLDEGDVTLITGIVEVPAGTCGAQLIDVSAKEDGGWRLAGSARLDIPCPVGG